MNIFNRRPKLNRDAVNDVVQLSTNKSLDFHASKAAEKADTLLATATTDEDHKTEELKSAKKRLELAKVVREGAEQMADSVMSIVKNLRK